MAEKVTIMKLKVDLQCEKCSKKVKNVLCKFPQIQDQVFDEKQDIVTIKVVCCNPENIRDKLCCKGCGSIMSIEIVEEKKKECNESPPGSSRVCCVPCSEGRPGGPCFEVYYGRPPPVLSHVPSRGCCVPCSEGRPGGPCVEGYYGRPPSVLVKPKEKPQVPSRVCCVPCSEGRPGGPCFEGYYGRPPPFYDGYFYVRPVYDSYGGGRPCYASRCDQYFSDENPSGCTVM